MPLKRVTAVLPQIIWQALFAKPRFRGMKFCRSNLWWRSGQFFNSISSKPSSGGAAR